MSVQEQDRVELKEMFTPAPQKVWKGFFPLPSRKRLTCSVRGHRFAWADYWKPLKCQRCGHRPNVEQYLTAIVCDMENEYNLR